MENLGPRFGQKSWGSLCAEISDRAISDSALKCEPVRVSFADILVVLVDCKYSPTCVGTAVTCWLKRLMAAF